MKDLILKNKYHEFRNTNKWRHKNSHAAKRQACFGGFESNKIGYIIRKDKQKCKKKIKNKHFGYDERQLIERANAFKVGFIVAMGMLLVGSFANLFLYGFAQEIQAHLLGSKAATISAPKVKKTL